jgi:hypothetical protein
MPEMPTGDPELLSLLSNATAGSALTNPRALKVPPGARQELHRPRVYVYKLPAWVAHSFVLEQPGLTIDIYGAFNNLLSQLLRDKVVRTFDPWEANLFYVPTFSYAVSWHSAPGRGLEAVRRVLRFIQAEYPALWARRGGRDHMVWAAGDRGACPLPLDLENLIWLARAPEPASRPLCAC